MCISEVSSIIYTSCVIIMVTAIIGWKMRKLPKYQRELSPEKNKIDLQNRDISQQEIISDCPELPEPNWVKVGRVYEMNIHPLAFGGEWSHDHFRFTEYGMSAVNNNGLIITDGMFLVFNIYTRRFETFWNYERLAMIQVIAVNRYKVKFSAPGMPNLEVDIDEKSKQTRQIYSCPMWQGSALMKCTDCGEEARDWLNKYLLSRFLRLVQTDYRPLIKPSNFTKNNWTRYVWLYNNMQEEEPKYYVNLTRYVVMTESTLKHLSDEAKTSMDTYTVRPNVIVAAPSFPSFAEVEWEWIKIGKAVMRKVKPVPRQRILEKSSKSLYISYDDSSHAGIYYGLYVSGNVNVNDDVFIHVPNGSVLKI